MLFPECVAIYPGTALRLLELGPLGQDERGQVARCGNRSALRAELQVLKPRVGTFLMDRSLACDAVA